MTTVILWAVLFFGATNLAVAIARVGGYKPSDRSPVYWTWAAIVQLVWLVLVLLVLAGKL